MSNLDLIAAAGNSIATASGPEGVSFDGTDDYLSRSSDLTGNADGKTFTFSAFVYLTSGLTQRIYSCSTSGTKGLDIFVYSAGEIQLTGLNASGGTIFSAYTNTAETVPDNTFTHILVSIDLANTSNRSVYVGDVLQSVTWSTYTNDSIDFTKSDHQIGNFNSGGSPVKGRLSNLFLDYTYRDLSIEANRRLFIDADGKPVDASGLSPILYLPMTDAATAGDNAGTGGDFTQNGVLDTAQRGANQYNCVASEFDGVADYLNSVDITATNGKEFTFSCVTTTPASSLNYKTLLSIGDTGTDWLYVRLSTSGVSVATHTTGGSQVAVGSVSSVLGESQTHSIQLMLDTTSEAGSKLFIDGVDASISWSTFVNDTFVIDDDLCRVGHSCPNTYAPTRYTGSIGELYFDDTYTDLSTDNPFWDADNNLPKPVAQVIEETGTTPLIALPIRGDDAGNNLGTGGDFTVYSGPFTGARGGSEFWARSASFPDSTSSYLGRTSSLSGAANGKAFTCAIAVYLDGLYTGGRPLFQILSGGNSRFKVEANDELLRIEGQNTSGTTILSVSESPAFTAGAWYLILASVDLTDSGSRDIYINGVDVIPSWSTYTNDNIELTASTQRIGYDCDADIGFLYFDDSYIDFSQESNRNLFIDQLSYPKDLSKQIADGLIPDPLIYMPFDDTDALGTNNGTGGNFTVNGTVTAGADVNP
jgi:hypothetical protein